MAGGWGHIGFAFGVVGAVVAVVAGAPLRFRVAQPTTRSSRVPVASSRAAAAGLVVATVGCWIALGRLAGSFLDLDLGNAYVADQARRGASRPYRLAGVWGGMDGSFLLWVTLLASVGLLGRGVVPNQLRGRFDAVIGAVVAASLVLLWAAADPFRRLARPAVDGRGLTPILEHPAMLYHPPLLYLGLVVTVVPFALVLAAGPEAHQVWPTARRLAGLALAVLTAGLATGANWSYVELGWGGYWGWDPVENAALVPWLALVAVLHAGRRLSARGVVLAGAAPFLLASTAAVLARSGANVSVHAFAENAAVGWSLAALLTGLAALTAWRALGASARPRSSVSRPLGGGVPLGLVAVGLATVAGAVVLAGVLYPVVIGWFGRDERTVEGTYFARLLAPLGTVVVVGSIVAAARAWRQGRRAAGQTIAHAGVLLFAIGVAGSVFATQRTVVVEAGGTVEVGGVQVRNEGVRVEPGERAGVDRVVATVVIDRGGSTSVLHPELVVFSADPATSAGGGFQPSGVLAETALRSSPLVDIQVVLRRATDDGSMILDVGVRPLVWWIWWGAAVMALGGALAARVSSADRAVRVSSADASGRGGGPASRTAPTPRAGAPDGPEPAGAVVPDPAVRATGSAPSRPAGRPRRPRPRPAG